jgi:hypothetical protein
MTEKEQPPAAPVAEIGSHRHGVADVPHFVFHRGRVFLLWLAAQTAVFPLEHWLWEKAPGLRSITHWLGL